MKSKTIATIVGARPQFIKAAMLSPLLSQSPYFEEKLIHTGQHFDDNMSEIFFREMGMQSPWANLDIHSLPPSSMIGQMMIALENTLNQDKPDMVLLYGDTNSTLAGALAAKKMDIPIIHIEAGLRRHNKSVPEEVNRLLTDHISDLLFAPTQTAVNNLKSEGLSDNVHNVGDIMLDAFKQFSSKANNRFSPEKPYALATLHRAENTDNPQYFRSLLEALSSIPIQIVLPLHPRTAAALERYDCKLPANIVVLPPVGYLDILGLLKNAIYVLTDSGGLQKEAFFAHKPCLILRDQTPWVELVEHQFARIVGSCPQNLPLSHDWAMQPLKEPLPIYGTGQTAENILSIITQWALQRN